MEQWVGLDELAIGQSAVIESIEDAQQAIRLAELGASKGDRITVLNIAPGGSPMLCKVNRLLLAIRKEESRNIKISMHG